MIVLLVSVRVSGSQAVTARPSLLSAVRREAVARQSTVRAPTATPHPTDLVRSVLPDLAVAYNKLLRLHKKSHIAYHKCLNTQRYENFSACERDENWRWPTVMIMNTEQESFGCHLSQNAAAIGPDFIVFYFWSGNLNTL